MKIFKDLKHRIVDAYLTWKTGQSFSERQWRAWYDETVIWRSDTIDGMFQNFKHVIIVKSDLFMQEDPFSWHPCEDAQQYFWPAREIPDTAVWRFERVWWDQWENKWYINSLGGEDKVFVATNNDRDAFMIKLKYL